MRISDWSSDVCSSDLYLPHAPADCIAPQCVSAIAPRAAGGLLHPLRRARRKRQLECSICLLITHYPVTAAPRGTTADRLLNRHDALARLNQRSQGHHAVIEFRDEFAVSIAEIAAIFTPKDLARRKHLEPPCRKTVDQIGRASCRERVCQ